MFRILVSFSAFGDDESIRLLSGRIGSNIGKIEQIGMRSVNPARRSLSFSTPWFEIDSNMVSDEIYSFIEAHKNISIISRESDFNKITLRITVCPAEETEENKFSCLLTSKTIKRLAELELELEIAPAVVMPNAPRWQCSLQDEP